MVVMLMIMPGKFKEKSNVYIFKYLFWPLNRYCYVTLHLIVLYIKSTLNDDPVLWKLNPPLLLIVIIILLLFYFIIIIIFIYLYRKRNNGIRESVRH